MTASMGPNCPHGKEADSGVIQGMFGAPVPGGADGGPGIGRVGISPCGLPYGLGCRPGSGGGIGGPAGGGAPEGGRVGGS
jgi:hypothetical protein